MSNCGGFSHPKARKAYICDMCCEVIPKTEVHAHFTGKWNGDWQDWRAHEECNKAYQDSLEANSIDGFLPEDFKRPTKESK